MTKTKTKAKTKEPEDSHPGGVSRRSFARGAALAGAAAALLPAHLLAQAQSPAPTAAAGAEKPPEPSPKLSPASQAEAEGKIQNIMRKYGSRLSDAEKADVRKSVLSQQESIDKLRAFPLENWDEPALVLRAVLQGK